MCIPWSFGEGWNCSTKNHLALRQCCLQTLSIYFSSCREKLEKLTQSRNISRPPSQLKLHLFGLSGKHIFYFFFLFFKYCLISCWWVFADKVASFHDNYKWPVHSFYCWQIHYLQNINVLKIWNVTDNKWVAVALEVSRSSNNRQGWWFDPWLLQSACQTVLIRLWMRVNVTKKEKSARMIVCVWTRLVVWSALSGKVEIRSSPFAVYPLFWWSEELTVVKIGL